MTKSLTHMTHTDALYREEAGGLNVATYKRYTPPWDSQRNASACVSASVQAAELLALACAVGRLSPDRRDPERFHMDKSELVAQLRRLARTLGKAV